MQQQFYTAPEPAAREMRRSDRDLPVQQALAGLAADTQLATLCAIGRGVDCETRSRKTKIRGAAHSHIGSRATVSANDFALENGSLRLPPTAPIPLKKP